MASSPPQGFGGYRVLSHGTTPAAMEGPDPTTTMPPLMDFTGVPADGMFGPSSLSPSNGVPDTWQEGGPMMFGGYGGANSMPHNIGAMAGGFQHQPQAFSLFNHPHQMGQAGPPCMQFGRNGQEMGQEAPPPLPFQAGPPSMQFGRNAQEMGQEAPPPLPFQAGPPSMQFGATAEEMGREAMSVVPFALPTGPPCACGQPSAQRSVKKEGPNTGRFFYSCPRPQNEPRCSFFAWADELHMAEQTGAPTPQPLPPGPPCMCGNASAQRMVRKEGPNKGRCFFCCSRPLGQQQCNFFVWTDEPLEPQIAALTPDGPPCFCNRPTSKKSVRTEGPNTGRNYFTCSLSREEQCGYFQWADEQPPTTGAPCQCGRPSINRTVNKEGPNKGRPYSSCAARKCPYFQWGDEPPSNAPRPFATPMGSHRAFGNEGMVGQFPNHFPQMGNGAYGGKGGGFSNDTCFKCGMAGHWANNCPHTSDDGFGGSRKGYGGKKGGKGKAKGSSTFEPY